jgi:sporulation protein YlmC with PRC-barrel domain
LYLAPYIAAFALLLGAAAPGAAAISKASGWVGTPVTTAAGEPLGRVEDFALDLDGARIEYVVISVGSFLIEDNLIAVAPGALTASADGESLQLDADNLAAARRFRDNWPARADVLPRREPDGNLGGGPGALTPGDAGPGFPRAGKAVISDGRRQATMEAGERKIEVIEKPLPPRPEKAEGPLPPDPAGMPLPEFLRLDGDEDSRLSRREIGPHLGHGERYGDIDVDGDGAIDPFEYELLLETRSRETGNAGTQ